MVYVELVKLSVGVGLIVIDVVLVLLLQPVTVFVPTTE